MPVKREQTKLEICEVLSLSENTVTAYIQAGCPHSRVKKRVLMNDGEVRDWMEKTGRTGQPGRPKSTASTSDEPDGGAADGTKDFWLARKYRVQALEAEGAMMLIDEVKRLGASAISTFRNSVLGLPSKLAVQLEGLGAAERQEVIESEFTHLLEELARRLRQLGGSGSATEAAQAVRVG